VLWQLIITFIFVPERMTKRLNCGSAKHYLLFLFWSFMPTQRKRPVTAALLS
jgi:hypothetical protein